MQAKIKSLMVEQKKVQKQATVLFLAVSGIFQ